MCGVQIDQLRLYKMWRGGKRVKPYSLDRIVPDIRLCDQLSDVIDKSTKKHYYMEIGKRYPSPYRVYTYVSYLLEEYLNAKNKEDSNRQD